MILMILAPLVGVLGAILLSFGAWVIYPPAGYITGGILCLLWSWLVSRSLSGNWKIESGESGYCFFPECLRKAPHRSRRQRNWRKL